MTTMRMLLTEEAVDEYLAEHELEVGAEPLEAVLLQLVGTQEGRPCAMLVTTIDGKKHVIKTTLRLFVTAARALTRAQRRRRARARARLDGRGSEGELLISAIDAIGIGVACAVIALFVGMYGGAWLQEHRGEIMSSFKLELGSEVRCKITGYTGLVTGRHEYLYGCRRYSVQAKELKDGKPVEHIVGDEDQFDIVTQAPPHEVKSTGGPQTEPSRQREPSRPREAAR